MRKSFLIAVVFMTLGSLDAVARSSAGPPTDRVRLCGTNQACSTSCHVADPTSTSRAVVTIELTAPTAAPFPPTFGYAPATNYSFIIRVVESSVDPRCLHPPRVGGCVEPSDTCRFGFQITGVPMMSCAATPLTAGCFFSTSPDVAVQGVCGGGLQFANHVNCGWLPTTVTPTTQEREWSFDWLSPPPGTGPVAFFAAVNSANASGTNAGDSIYFENPIWDEASTTAACDLRSASSLTLTNVDRTLLFSDTTACVGDALPSTVLVPNFSTTPTLADPIAGTPLTVYKVECPCPGTLFLIKGGLNVTAQWM